MTREELLEALLVERYTSPWWTARPAAAGGVDDELTTARRRRAMADDFEASYSGRAAR